jgi:hypothetical protein
MGDRQSKTRDSADVSVPAAKELFFFATHSASCEKGRIGQLKLVVWYLTPTRGGAKYIWLIVPSKQQVTPSFPI